MRICGSSRRSSTRKLFAAYSSMKPWNCCGLAWLLKLVDFRPGKICDIESDTLKGLIGIFIYFHQNMPIPLDIHQEIFMGQPSTMGCSWTTAYRRPWVFVLIFDVFSGLGGWVEGWVFKLVICNRCKLLRGEGCGGGPPYLGALDLDTKLEQDFCVAMLASLEPRSDNGSELWAHVM